jgi:hypothetical protein
MVNYFIAMSIRVVCIILCLVVPGWWAVIPAIGAIVLPYIAVVIANVGEGESAGIPLRPGGLLPAEPRDTARSGSADSGPAEDAGQDTGQRDAS